MHYPTCTNDHTYCGDVDSAGCSWHKCIVTRPVPIFLHVMLCFFVLQSETDMNLIIISACGERTVMVRFRIKVTVFNCDLIF